jgi:hypothetical protein
MRCQNPVSLVEEGRPIISSPVCLPYLTYVRAPLHGHCTALPTAVPEWIVLCVYVGSVAT